VQVFIQGLRLVRISWARSLSSKLIGFASGVPKLHCAARQPAVATSQQCLVTAIAFSSAALALLIAPGALNCSAMRATEKGYQRQTAMRKV